MRTVLAVAALALFACDPYGGEWTGSATSYFGGAVYPGTASIAATSGRFDGTTKDLGSGNEAGLNGTYDGTGGASITFTASDGSKSSGSGTLEVVSGQLVGEFTVSTAAVTGRVALELRRK